MSIGQRKPFKLVDETPTRVNGEPVPKQVTILRSWADVRSISSNRAVENNQTKIGKLFEFRFRYRSDISVNQNVRLVYDGKRYTIQSIEKDKQKKFYWTIRVEQKSFG